MEKCLTCLKEFKSLKGLHSHVKVHGGVESYYQTHFPRYDLYDGSLIEFKNRDQYLDSFFNSDENRRKFYLDVSVASKAKKYLLKELKANAEFKEYNFLPSDNFLRLSKLPTVELIKRHFGSCSQLCKIGDFENLFTKKPPKDFWTRRDFSELEIFIDTREQDPFKFAGSIVNKLDFGDYTASGEFYNKVFVERKGLGDFASSLSSGIDRFENELKRASKFQSYIIMVVEGTISDVEKHVEKLNKNRRPNLSYAFHNLRRLLLDYARGFQVVFCPNRLAAQDFTQRVLFYGDFACDCDLQYFLDQHYGLV